MSLIQHKRYFKKGRKEEENGRCFTVCLDDFAREIRRHYLAATAYMDSMVGKVLTELENQNLANRTIIVEMGDHGWTLGELGEWSKFSNMYHALRVPLLISVPGFTDVSSNSGIVNTTLVSGTYTKTYYTISFQFPKHVVFFGNAGQSKKQGQDKSSGGHRRKTA